MNKFPIIYRYLKYLLKSKTRYRIHSQFVFDFVNNILRDKTLYGDYNKLWEHRNKLAGSDEFVETVDFGAGAGDKAYSTKIVKYGKIVRLRSNDEPRLKLLYRIVKYYKPDNILEFGTAAGISTVYIKSGNPISNMITLEGCANLAAKANESFNELGFKKLNIAVGDFDSTLKDVLQKLKKLDFVFFDGNHRKEPTLRYFEKCMQFSNESSIFVFDDIHWSKGMESAWEYIKNDSRVSITIDLFWFGIVFLRKGIDKQNFILHY